jgi:3-oxoadipate enol-lactonase
MPNIHINNIKIHYEHKGSGDPILFLHGLGSCGADWLFQIPVFSKKYHVFTPDLRGHGKSEKKGPYSITQAASDMKEFIEKLKIGPVHLVGLSYGSFVALQLALTSPHLVKSLTLAGTTSNTHNANPWKMWLRRFLLTFSSMQTVGKVVSWSLFPDIKQEALRKVCSSRIASNPKSIYRALFHDILHFNVEKELIACKSPLLLICGAKDTLLPVSHAAKIKAHIPHALLEILPEARHASPLDSPEEFNTLLQSFLLSQQRH